MQTSPAVVPYGFLPSMTPWDLHLLRWYHPAPIEPTHIDHKDLGMSAPVYALVVGILSGISLPLGAWLGILFSPVSNKVTSMMMAFGAGALLFAVTVELYAHTLMEVMSGKSGSIEMSATVIGAFAGCAGYLAIEKWLHDHLIPDDCSDLSSESPTESDPILHHLRNAVHVPKQAAESETSSNMQRQSSWRNLGEENSALRRMSMGAQRIRAVEKAVMVVQTSQVQHARSAALALFLGLLCDGVPEGILMGFLAAESHLTPVLVVSLFIANFPTAFSSSSLLVEAQMSFTKNISLWCGLCLLVGCLAGLSCWVLLTNFPEFGQAGFQSKHLPLPVLIGIALVEGVTGGAMLACISGVMLPEAFQRSGHSNAFYSHSGFLCVAGFIASLILKTLFG